VNARARQLLDELLQMSAEDRAHVAAELEASLDESAKQAKRARFEAAVGRVVKDHEAILSELAK
jgi:ribosomal protein L29